jgi:cytoskeletal protein RodZ
MKIKGLTRKNQPTKPTTSWQEQRCKQLAQIGAELHASRLEKGLSLEDMVMLTMIPQRLLQAIEDGDLSELPEPVYTQALIRLSADAIGLDGTELAKRFPTDVDEIVNEPANKKLITNPLRPFHLYLMYTGLIFCSVSGLSQMLNNNSLQARNPSPVQTPNIRHQTDTKPRSGSQDLPTDKESVQIGLTVKEKSWVRVIADGKVKYEGDLPKGYHRTWQAEEELTVRTGNAGGVLVSVNQTQAKAMGEPGEVEEVKIAAKPRS